MVWNYLMQVFLSLILLFLLLFSSIWWKTMAPELSYTTFGRMMKDSWSWILMLIHMYVDSWVMYILSFLFQRLRYSSSHIWCLILQDIQIRGVNRAEKNIQMAKEFPNSRFFLTYRHSLRVKSNFTILVAQLSFPSSWLGLGPAFRTLYYTTPLPHSSSQSLWLHYLLV